MSKLFEEFQKIYKECIDLRFIEGFPEFFEKHIEKYRELTWDSKTSTGKDVRCSACEYFNNKTVDKMSDEKLLEFCKQTIQKYNESLSKVKIER